MRSIYDEKKRHGLALELATLLIAADFSWDITRLALNESMMQTAVGLPFPDSEDSGGFSITSTEDPSAPFLEKSNPPAIPLHIATEHGILEIVKETLRVHPAAYEYRNTKGQNILHLSIMHRQRDIFDLVMKKETPKSRLQRQLDINDFTVLHQVGNIEHYNGGTQPGPALQLQEELEWFEKVEGLIPLHYEKFSACEAGKDTTLQSFHKRYVEILKDLSENIEVDKIITPDSHKEEKKKETPIEYFRRTHDPLLQSAQEWLKRTSESCSTVAGLMATVAFAAAFTLPGGNDENSGTPRLLHSPFFLVFIITDALSLASSLTSLVMFLSILTSPFEMDDFRHSLPRKLILGFTFLFISVAVTMLAFASTLMLTIPMKKRVTKSFVYCVAFLPVTMFALLQFPLLLAFKKSLKYPVMAMKRVWRLLISASILKSDKTQ
ncbi:putative ankyrin repeat-containing domain, PGG domain-containing protein [Rosa chinensis]|uniref:Putative ankyrin repeat-containing domain, PGG domain-containing protein n=2 Tax=Rosa chinensis TaxID=74649 RepID=A0A2P6Q2A5_ROSCH|nr:putative ankyrin repeat-containing domain, PGG domain-containing protein [Rosa chinensis]